MSLNFRRFISFIGSVTLDHVKAIGGESWKDAIPIATKRFEDMDPKVKKAKIKGAKPHKSHKDPTDPKPVISVQLLDEEERRITTIHVHEDGTATEKP
ncbi:hypothetical protein QM012_007006 [Aureobasidium pullulans]|uniref:Uncharacterized protein n=1 Tax=Aureobasidium pullulans TaxID=5580 RepID=A0ABR0TR58_AURPU